MIYKDLDIYKMAMELFLKKRPLSLKLPKYELYELVSQVRRSAQTLSFQISLKDIDEEGIRQNIFDFSYLPIAVMTKRLIILPKLQHFTLNSTRKNFKKYKKLIMF